MLTLFRRWNVQVPGSRSLAWIAVLSALLLPGAFPAQATSCLGSNLTYSESGNNSTTFGTCSFWGRCQQPVGTLLGYSFNVSGCDPHSTSCGMTASVAATFPGNHQNDPSQTGFVYSFAEVDLKSSTGSLVGACGTAGAVIAQDTGLATVSASVTCSNPSASHYTLNLISCPSASPGSCTKTASVDLDFAGAAGCNTPPPDDCNTCGGCVAHGGGGPAGCSSPVRGAGPACGPVYSGPVAHP